MEAKNCKSKCCNASVEIEGFPDFIGDDPKTMEVATCCFRCTKCKEFCDVVSTSKPNPINKAWYLKYE